ncbi:penicillin-binding transpeptidase domain-containing protein [Brachybacterium saurashtrense]|uniref:Cell division protein FtsI n=1 Tax=Brachybacterium saurashtrense TaxID=556288 RepID=A0A345YJZ0_9MICO|nr:penicillin-binding transpeptidase domain-containing protein [Brachybacterium saurashtrense]AXK44242.1 cell division protein FtsI [Brachybacterium saurashtrense]RRR21514.1 cell division protein FtsI [Brachybacterium saurashtrense]
MAPASPTSRRRGPLLVLIALLAIAALVATYLLVRGRFDTGEEAARQLAAALTAGEVPAGADAAQHERILAGMLEEGAVPSVALADPGRAESGERTVTLDWTWTLPQEAGTWEYSTEATLHRGEDGWEAALEPSAYAPDLTAGEHLVLAALDPALGEITDRDGTALYAERPVITLGLDRSRLEDDQVDQAARALAGLLGTDPDRLAEAAAAAGEEAFVAALTIREEDAGAYPLDRAADEVPGYLAVDGTRPLALERDYAPGVLGALREATAEDVEDSDGEIEAGDLVATGGVVAATRDELLGTEGVEVRAVDEDAEEQRPLHTVAPADGTTIATTLDDDLQRLATEAVAEEDSPAAVIALQPSTGDVLAAALGPTGQSYPVGLVGQYAPGSTFKTVTALALLRAGVTPDTELECPETATVAGRSFKNADSMDPALFGPMPLRSAVAHSCNTALLLQHETADQAALADAATTLGLGQDAPTGLDAFMGSIDPADEGVEHAAAMIGQGRVLTSPLSMAVVLASVQNGATVTPRILADDEPAAPEVPTPLTEEETAQMQEMLRGVVTDGSLDDFADLPGEPVIGKTGTAEWTNADGELRLHSWVIVAQGDLVVAAFVEDGSYGSVTAGPIAREVLAGQ